MQLDIERLWREDLECDTPYETFFFLPKESLEGLLVPVKNHISFYWGNLCIHSLSSCVKCWIIYIFMYTYVHTHVKIPLHTKVLWNDI